VAKVRPKRVRYIKLGRKGSWEKHCIENGEIIFGFDTGSTERFPLCVSGQWDKLARSFEKKGKSKSAATNITNQAQAFFEDVGTTLWLTFYGERLYWGFASKSPPQPHADKRSVIRVIRDGWKCSDLLGDELSTDRLSGALTKLRSYRGTSCEVDVKDYAIRRINGQKLPEVESAIECLAQLRDSVLRLLKLLGPKDFELLVDLVFTTSGWRRLGVVGKTQKTLDLDLILPSTEERAFVQVKSHTSQGELEDYIGKIDELGPYQRMFYIYHSGSAKTDDKRVRVIGPEKFAELVVDAGLVDWLIRKIS
jgi:hypothetical protein